VSKISAMKKQAPTPPLQNTPPGCTPFVLLKPIDELPKELLGIDALIAASYSPDEGPEPVADALGLFFAAVQGDRVVINGLFNDAVTLIAVLGAVAKRNPDVLRPIARKQLFWPDLIGVKEGSSEHNRWLLKHLEVGKECSMRGKWNPKSPATQTALLMYTWLRTNQGALGLPPLAQETRKQSFWKAGSRCSRS
jgi:hypothetical protein